MGAATTSGEAFNVTDAHVHYAYDASIDELLLQARYMRSHAVTYVTCGNVRRVD